MAPIRLGVVGLSTRGWASQALIPPIFTPPLSSLYTLTALCTSSEASAKASVEKYSGLAGHPVKGYYGEKGPEQLANDPNVDMVVVSVKIPDHLKTVTPAIEAGKKLFVEWTLGNGARETEMIAEAIRSKNLECLIGAQAKQSKTVRKVKELVDAGKIGRILSTSAIVSAAPAEANIWGPIVTPDAEYASSVNNGATPLTVEIGHFLVALTDVLGDFSQVCANGAVRFPTAKVITYDGQPTGKSIQSTSHDQVSLSGILSGKPHSEGAFVNIHCRSGLTHSGEGGKGRRQFIWVIDGEDGSIEVFLNGVEVPLDEIEEDKLGNTGKAWLHFANGDEGKYPTINDAIRLHRVLDAALLSIQEGRKVKV
ncbi:unnamed protein product [Somion occarium]|uniref:Gfo/Idh/MocA-like oxidoreductase N-terminal domain-containing protein n=1 Tax=Somion occarium TaxID=3059160 RepID=A0ABP1DYY2_9APHY